MTTPRLLRSQPRRVAMISVHTSPVDQPGSGDAGGLNVYVRQVAGELARRGTAVEVFTRATSPEAPRSVEILPGVLVHNVVAGPFAGLGKDQLPAQLCAMTAAVLRSPPSARQGWFDLVHSHYWLSGQVGWLAKERWEVPLVHTMHTMGRVKNANLAHGDAPEPVVRLVGEQQVVDAADRLLANTAAEREELIRFYDADPEIIDIASPGVDLQVFRPGPPSPRVRAELGVAHDDRVVLFVGRVQPLKAPDLLVQALAQLPDPLPQTHLVICGGSTPGQEGYRDHLLDLAVELGLAGRVHLLPAQPHAELAGLYRAADVVAVPSHNESFGLVAIEAQACGTPVVAAAVGGLTAAVADGASGLLVPSFAPADWGAALGRVLGDDSLRRRLAAGARRHAAGFSWAGTGDAVLASYEQALWHPRGELAVAG